MVTPWKYISDNFFDVCQNQTVLEVGPFIGDFSKEILQHNPKKLCLLEASYDLIQPLKNKFSGQLEVYHGDMHRDFDQFGKIDVAILLGVIYHSHAPLWVLEELVNKCDPEQIIIDNPGDFFNCLYEDINRPGMRYTEKNQKSCKMVITIDDKILVTSMKNLGYNLSKKDQYPESTGKWAGIPIYRFEKYNG